MSSKITRRDFVAGTGKLAMGAMIVPRHVLGGPGYQAPSDTLNIAVVGFGGMGSGNSEVLAQTENIVAVCDVDMAFAARNVDSKQMSNNQPRPEGQKLKAQFDKAAKYTDWREMLAKQKDIDAVLVATPDHNHAVVANAAMLAGKHVYVQKPLTYSVHEARVLRETARKTKVVTQMGNQGHSTEGARLINEWIAAGVIGPVREVHVWTNRPTGYWPQGVPRPTGTMPANRSWSQGGLNTQLAAAMAEAAVTMPDGLRWDMYLGPVAEDIAYHPVYHPFQWRGWTDFGVGALGDMGAHLIDHPYWALGLTQPTTIEATSTPWGTTRVPGPVGANGQATTVSRNVSYPLGTTVHYQFPARGNMPPVKLFWFDGGLYPPRPDVLPDTETLKSEGGVIFIGEKGILMNDTYGANPRCFPLSLNEAAKAVAKTMPRITTSHELNWANACKGIGTASSPFEYATQLTETMLLGVVALKTGQGRKLIYDAANMNVTNIAAANQYLTREYRPGWAI